MIPKELIQEFKEIAKDEYGEDLTFDEAEEIGTGLALYFSLLKKVHIQLPQKKVDYI